MKLLKKTIASIALVTLVSSLFTTGAFAYSPAELSAAEALAAEGIIVAKADAMGYNLDQNVLRQEIAAVARAIAGLDKKTNCAGTFTDVTATTPNNWACYSVEALSDAWLITIANATFRPEANITKAEAVGMMVKAKYGADYVYNPALGTTWQEQVVAFAATEGIVTNFTNYEALATRGFVFEVGASAISAEWDDLLGDLFGDLMDDEEDTTDTDDTEDTDDTVVSGDNVLTVDLAADTPESATVPGSISGLPVAKFDFTAGSEDVTVTELTVKRKGLSDEDTLTALAVFSDEGRASKSKDDTQENDTQALLTLSNGGLIIKAGETRTITIVADINNAAQAQWDEFAIELLDVTTASEVDWLTKLVWETMKVGWVDAAELVFEYDWDVSDVKVWDEWADVFKFKVTWADNEDIILKSVTIKGEGSVDESDDMSNFQLEMEGKVVATTASANGKYITFDLNEGVTIAEDKTINFVVLADINSWVTETISFIIDKELDISAEGTKYGYWAAVNISDIDETSEVWSIEIDAWELTLADVDASSDKVRPNKKDVELGTIKVTNVSWDSLELQKFRVDYDITSTNTSYDSAVEIFDNFEVVINGGTYELELDTDAVTDDEGTYSDNDLNVTIPEGETTMIIRADTKENVPDGVEVTISVSEVWDDGFYAVEMEDEEQVTDITPSDLAFKKVTFIDAGATLSAIPLADATVVRWAPNVSANKFEIEADEASEVIVDEIKATLNVTDGSAINFSSTGAKNYVSEMTLYKGSISEANILKKVSGSKITASWTDWIVTFDWFETTIAADASQEFIITVSIVDSITVEAAVITVSVEGADVSAEDDDSDDVIVSWNSDSVKDITVSGQGTVNVTANSDTDDNKDPKTILAWESAFVYSADVEAVNEDVEVDTVVFTISDWLTNAVSTASLFLDDKLIATNSNSDITWGTAATAEVTSLTVTTANTSAGNAVVNLNWTANNVALTYSAGAAAEVTTLTVTNVAWTDGTIRVIHNWLTTYIPVLAADTTAQIATKIQTAINATADTATVAGSVVTITAAATWVQTDATFTAVGTFATATVSVTTQWAAAATTTTTAAAEIASAIDALGGYTATSAGAVVTITAVTAWAQTDATFTAWTTGAAATVSVTTQWVTGSTTTVTFENLTGLIIPQKDAKLRLKLNTANIGYGKVGESLTNVTVTNVSLDDAEWVDSGNTVTITDLGATAAITKSNEFSIVPSVVTPTLYAKLNDSTTPQFDLTVNSWNNTEAASNSSPATTIDTIEFSLLWTTDANSSMDYALVNVDDSSDSINGAVVWNTLTFTLADFTNNNNWIISNWSTKRYKLIITNAEVDADSLTLTLLEDGINYTVSGYNVDTNLSKELVIGTRTY